MTDLFIIKKKALTLVVMTVAVIWGCKPSVPSDTIQPGKMEDILYDYHLAKSINSISRDRDVDADVGWQAYKLAVLEKHGVSEEDFEKSLAYYMRHADRLQDIYESLSERLEGETSALGVPGGASTVRTYSLTGDTANVWTGDPSIMLMPTQPYSSMSFHFSADSSYYKGDKMVLSFKPQYIIQDGSRDAVALLSVRFSNDSIASQTCRLFGNNPQSITIPDSKHLGIKDVKGFILFKTNNSGTNTQSTLRLLFISDIQLLKIHEKKSEQAAKDSSDIKMRPYSQTQMKPMPDSSQRIRRQIQPPVRQLGSQPIPRHIDR